jgi:hypothetical protein
MLRVLFCFLIFFIGYEKTFGRKPTSRGHRTLHNASPTVNGLWFLLKKKRPRVALSLNDSHCYCELLRMHIQQCFWLTEPDYHNIVQTGSHTTDVRSVFSLVARAWHPSPSWCLFFLNQLHSKLMSLREEFIGGVNCHFYFIHDGVTNA